MAKNFREAGPLFYAGLILGDPGAATVSLESDGTIGKENRLVDLLKVISFVALPPFVGEVMGRCCTRDNGHARQPMRPFICVGMAYVVIAIAVPCASSHHWRQGFTYFPAAMWSLAGGVAGGARIIGGDIGIHLWRETDLRDAVGLCGAPW